MLRIVTVKPATVFGRTCVNDCQPSRLEPSLISVPPTRTSSTHAPGGTAADSPRVAGSLNVRKASSTVWPA